jgi:small ligand-binding sensory domain FIST
LNDLVHRGGAVGVGLSGNIVVDTVVAQGCRPIGRPMRVTEVQHNLVLSLDGETPLQKLQRLFETLSSRDQELVQRNLFMGIAMDPLLEDVRQGDFLIRNVIGIDPKRGAVAVGALLREGQVVQFHARDEQGVGRLAKHEPHQPVHRLAGGVRRGGSAYRPVEVKVRGVHQGRHVIDVNAPPLGKNGQNAPVG